MSGTYQQLLARHQQLLSQHERSSEAPGPLDTVRDYIEEVRRQAEVVGDSRDRDQLRSILRFWAVYLHQITGVYPNTTLRPRVVASEPTGTRDTSLHQMPPTPHDFTGRQEELTELLAQAEKGATVIGLFGMGGIGKTTFALKLAEELTDTYTDAQLYINALGTRQRPLSSEDIMSLVLRTFYPNLELPGSEEGLSGLYRSILHKTRALIVIDDAAEAEQIAPLVPPRSCLLVVTSRHLFTVPGMVTTNLSVFSAADARSLLMTIAPRIGDEANTVAELCGYLPLALRLAASMLAEHRDISVTHYVEQLSSSDKRLAWVDASLKLVFGSLNQRLQQLWCMLAAFPDSFDLGGAAAVWDLEHDLTQTHLSDLVKRSLVDWNAATCRYRMHELSRLFADANQPPDELWKSRQRHAVFYKEVLREANERYKSGGEHMKEGLDLFDREWKNIEAGLAWASANAEGSAEGAKLCSDYLRTGPQVLSLRMQPRERFSWLDVAIRAARKCNDHTSEGWHLLNLGIAYAETGDPLRAVEFSGQALDIARAVGDRRLEGYACCGLGQASLAQSETSRALQLCQEALRVAREIVHRRLELRALRELSRVHIATDRIRDTLDANQQRLRIARETGDLRHMAHALATIGVAHAEVSEPREATAALEEALELFLEIGDIKYQGYMLGNLGTVHSEFLGQFAKALACLGEALLIARTLGDRLAEGATLGNMGAAYRRKGDIRRSIDYNYQALAVARAIGDRAGEAITLADLGKAYLALGEREPAVENSNESLKIATEIGARQTEGACWNNLGKGYLIVEDIAQAMECFERARDIYRDIGDRRHEAHAITYLGRACYIWGDRARAVNLNEQALEMARGIGDQRSEAIVLGNYGTVWLGADDGSRARRYFERALALCQKVGDERYKVVSLVGLSRAREAFGDSKGAVQLSEHALKIAERIGDRLSQGACLQNLAVSYLSLGCRERMLECFSRAASTFKVIGNVAQIALIKEMMSAADNATRSGHSGVRASVRNVLKLLSERGV